MSDNNKKVTPKILPGFMELLPPDQIMFNKMYDTIRSVYERFGFLPLDTPVIEYSEVLLAKAGGETEKQIYRFNKGDNDLALRFDLTVPLARYVSQHYNDLTFPFKRYQMSKVYRGERPQKGRFREFYQCDIDIIGNESLDLIYDAEMPAVIYNVFKELDFGEFIIKINNRKVLNGFFANMGLSEKAGDVLRVIDKIEKIGAEAVCEELLKLEITQAQVDDIMSFIAIKGSTAEKLSALAKLGLDVENDTFKEGLDELKKVTEYMAMLGVDEAYYEIELTIARGLDYYTGTVYETMLKDYPQLGSICSGGRYDNLTEYYTKQSLPGIGISIGLTRLFSQLKEQEIIKNESKTLVKVLVLPMDKSTTQYCLNVASNLRNAGISTDVFYADKGMKQKMKYANKAGIPYIAIVGEDEMQNGTVTVKNMETGEQSSVELDKVANIIINR